MQSPSGSRLLPARAGARAQRAPGSRPHHPHTLAPLPQTAIAAAVGIYDVSWWTVALLGWVVSPFLAGSLMAAHHEISHLLVFKKPSWNRWLLCAANAPLSIPLGSLFKQYHQEHHSHMVRGW